jgi:poly-beta-1,6-N-acetyl-D-glucosamine synthase
VTAAPWLAGGTLFRLLEESHSGQPAEGGWPGVTVLIPGIQRERVIGASVRAVVSADYPQLEVPVLDDGSTDATEAAALRAAARRRSLPGAARPDQP